MMPQVFSILFGAAFTVAVMLSAGNLLIGALGTRFRCQEQYLFALPAGAACLSLAVFALACAHGARMVVFLVIGALVIGLSVMRRAWRRPGETLVPVPRMWNIGFWLLFAFFGYVYLVNAMAPETSPDGASYHLGLVSRYLDAGGMVRFTTTMYANLSQGVEMLYLFAFAIGRHSAAKLVHCAFLLALPLMIVGYARRFGFAKAGVAGALLVYLSPIVGFDGTAAYIDIAVVTVVFAIFYLLQIWDEERQPSLLILIGLLAGFAYAMKYTAFVAFPYAAAFVAWKTYRKGLRIVRPLIVLGACALVMAGPWVVRNWIWYDNPFSPFYNQWFPNPYVHTGFEMSYRAQLEHWGGVTEMREIPMEVTVHGGKLQGVLGPVFLLAPIALLALRYRQGRQLLLAAGVFLATYPSNIGTRFLIPCLPFLSVAMGMTLVNWKAMAPLVILMQALCAWPPYLKLYCDPYATRIERVVLKPALRGISEHAYLSEIMPSYSVARMVEEKVPRGAKVLAENAPPEAYTLREFVVGYQAALNNNLADMLKSARIANWQPGKQLSFRIQLQKLRRLRIQQLTERSTDYWSINELHLFDGSRELARDARWRLRAHPNPFEIQLAFDNNPMTRWRSWEPLSGTEYVEIDLGRDEQVDSLVMEATPDQWSVRLELDGQSEGGAWRPLANAPRVQNVPIPLAMRRMIAKEIRWQGVEYLLVWNSDLVAQDLRGQPSRWGVTLVGETNGARLYHID